MRTVESVEEENRYTSCSYTTEPGIYMVVKRPGLRMKDKVCLLTAIGRLSYLVKAKDITYWQIIRRVKQNPD